MTKNNDSDKDVTKKEVVVAKKLDLPEVKQNYADEVARLSKRLQAPGGSKIGVTQAKQFQMPDGAEVESFQGIIVEFASANYYFSKPFKRGEKAAADCFALSEQSLGMIPSENSPDVQSSDCGTCWASQWQSKGIGKACQETRLLAILPPDADDTTPLHLLKISPTGVRALDAYIAKCAREFQRPPRGIITTFVFDEKNEYASIRFVNPAPLSDELVPLIEAKLSDAKKLLLKEPTYNE